MLLMKKLMLIASGMILLASLAGCGEDSANNGTLSLTVTPTDLGGGRTQFKVSAVVTPAAANMKITITGRHVKKNGTPIYDTISEDILVNPVSGAAEKSFNTDGDSTEITYFESTAKIDRLFKQDTQPVPIYAP